MEVRFSKEGIRITGAPTKILNKAKEVIEIMKKIPAEEFEVIDEAGCLISDLDQMIISLFITNLPNSDFPDDFCGWIPDRVEDDVLWYIPECQHCVERMQTEIHIIDLDRINKQRMDKICGELIEMDQIKKDLVAEYNELFNEMPEIKADKITRELALEKITVLLYGMPTTNICEEFADCVDDFFNCMPPDNLDELILLLNELAKIHTN